MLSRTNTSEGQFTTTFLQKVPGTNQQWQNKREKGKDGHRGTAVVAFLRREDGNSTGTRGRGGRGRARLSRCGNVPSLELDGNLLFHSKSDFEPLGNADVCVTIF